MESLSAHHGQLLEAAREQMLAELDELFELPAGTPPEVFAQRLATDKELRTEVRERFERGRSSGKFPLLSRCESDFPAGAREMFLVVGWRLFIAPPAAAAPAKPWDRKLYDGNEEHYREDLYNGIAFAATDLRRFAKEWLEELARAGYLGVGGTTGLPLKQRVDGSAVARPASIPPFGEKAYPVRFENSRQVLWLQLEGERSSERGYREVRVADEPVRTDKAILAALTAMEGRKMDLKRLRRAIAEIELPPGGAMYQQWREAFEGLPPEQKSGRKRPELHENLQHHQSLDYVLLLLRHHRKGFDDLPQVEKLALVERTCHHINEFLEALRRLTAFLEFGVPGKHLKEATEDADRDVKAAVLHDVDGMTHREIGEELGVPLPDDYNVKGDHPTVRQMVKRGRKIIVGALGEECWRRHIRAMKEDAERWRSLSEAEQEAEELAEHLGIPYEEALRRAEEEEAYLEERRRSGGEPEND